VACVAEFGTNRTQKTAATPERLSEIENVFHRQSRILSPERDEEVTVATNVDVFPKTPAISEHPTCCSENISFFYRADCRPDLTLSPSDSLALLIDGQRHVSTQTNSLAAFVSRRGVTSLLYRVSPEVLVAIANANSSRGCFWMFSRSRFVCHTPLSGSAPIGFVPEQRSPGSFAARSGTNQTQHQRRSKSINENSIQIGQQ
jgi:hypothetical protein